MRAPGARDRAEPLLVAGVRPAAAGCDRPQPTRIL